MIIIYIAKKPFLWLFLLITFAKMIMYLSEDTWILWYTDSFPKIMKKKNIFKPKDKYFKKHTSKVESQNFLDPILV